MNYTFLVGTHRSGTTWLGGLLGTLPGTAYWSEPRQVWAYRNWKHPDDSLVASDADAKIRAHIRGRFNRFAESKNAEHFLEKTPSNCLRVDFMNSIFPDGKFILLVRDGRAVLRSTNEIQAGGAGWDRIIQRIRESSIKEMPAYLDRIPWVWRKMIGKRLDFWGVRPPDWQDWNETLSPMQVIAKQWSDSILAAKNAFEHLPPDRKLEVKYEDLVSEPEVQVRRILEFLEIQDGEPVIQQAIQSRRVESISKWRNEVSDELLDEVRSIIEPTLLTLGYRW